MSMLAFPATTPDALFTTLWATSKTPMTMLQVFVTIRTAQAVLNIHLKNIQVSTSCRLFLSVMSWISSNVITKARIRPAIGRMAVSDRLRIMLNTPPFQPWGVWPTWVAISPTFWFTLSNIPERLLVMPPTRISFSHCVSCSLI